MKRCDPESIGDVLRSFLEEAELSERIDELKAADLWPRVAGHPIAAECSKPSVKNGLMCIGVKNAALRNELHMCRSRLISLINEELGKQVIREIRFTS